MDNTFDNEKLYIMSRAGSNLFGAGKIDDIKIYDYARTPAQIAYDYNRGGPITRYDMDECSGTTIHNSTVDGNNVQLSAYNGTFTVGSSGQTSMGDCTTNANTPWYNGRIGKYSSSVNLDGTDDYLEIGTTVYDVAATDSYTFSAWVNTTDTVGEIGMRYSFTNVGTTPYFKFEIGGDCSNGIPGHHMRGTGGGETLLCGNKTINDGTWHHYVAVRNQILDTNYLYIDGKLVSSVTDSTSGNLYLTTTPSNPLSLGAMRYWYTVTSAWVTAGYLSGMIDSVSFYKYPLSAAQVKILYNEGSAVRFGQ